MEPSEKDLQEREKLKREEEEKRKAYSQSKRKPKKIQGKAKVIIAQRAEKAKETHVDDGIRWSNFWVLINTNKPVIDDDHFKVFTAEFKKVIYEMFDYDPENPDREENFAKMGRNMMKFYGEDHQDDIWDGDYIDACFLRVVLEEGKKQGRLHAHCLLEITHTSCIQVDYLKVQDFVDTRLVKYGVGSCCIPKIISGDEKTVLRYMAKDMADEEELLLAFKELAVGNSK